MRVAGIAAPTPALHVTAGLDSGPPLPPEVEIEVMVLAPAPGRVSVRVTVSPCVIAAGPRLVTVTVQVMVSPGVTVAGAADLVTARS